MTRGRNARFFDSDLDWLVPFDGGRAAGGPVLDDDDDYEDERQEVPGPESEEPDDDADEEPYERALGGRVEARNIDHNPTEAQKHVGNYAKDHVNIHGLKIAIENARGSKRRGVDKNGEPWECKVPCAYGYIKGTHGADDDHVDVYVGPHIKAPHVFVLDQVDKDSKKFDEHKVGIGFGSKAQFINTYKKAFSDGNGQARIGAVAELTLPQFRSWLKNGDTRAPLGW